MLLEICFQSIIGKFCNTQYKFSTCAKYAFKGALIATVLGATYTSRELALNTFAINKARVFVDKNNLAGPILIALR